MFKRNLILLITGSTTILLLITLIVYLHNKQPKTDPTKKTCDASNSITNGVASPCTSSLADGSTCNPTCDTNYTLTGNRSCKNGKMTDTALCSKTDPTKKTCDASNSITNGVASPCTSSLADGSTCNPTCDTNYTLTGNRSCKNGKMTDTALCSKTDPTRKHGPPTQEQLDSAKKTVKAYSDIYSGDPFIMFVNYTKDKVVARLGSGYGLIPCSSTDTNCTWGNNPGISKIHELGQIPQNVGFDTGINKSYQILNPNECWLIKIPLNSGSPDFWNGDPKNNGKKSKDGQNLYFAYGLTGKFFDISGIRHDSYDDAIAAVGVGNEYKLFPECNSNSYTNLAVGNQSQLELTLSGSYSATDLSSVNGVSRPFYLGMYNSKTGDNFNCKYGDETRNYLYCDYDREHCEFPEVDNTYQVKNDTDGLPYNCLQPGIACKFYVKNPKVTSAWGEDLDTKFTFTDPHGTTWNTGGCVSGTQYCTKTTNNKLQYMGMDLTGGSCELLNGGEFLLNGDNWVTGATPDSASNDKIWTKYQPACGDNFGSISDRLRMCKYDTSDPSKCPVRGGGSCLSNNGTGTKDSWSSDVVQRFCESCHSDTCRTYCQSYDDYWGTMTCPLSSVNTPNVIVITY